MTGAPQVSSYVLGKILYHLCSDGPLPLRHVFIVSKAFFYAATNMLNCGQLYPLILLLLAISLDDQSSTPMVSLSSAFFSVVNFRSAFALFIHPTCV